MEPYEELLNKAYKKVKKSESETERFEIPRAKSSIEGKKTVLINFGQISSYLSRKPDHIQKFLSKELATSGFKEGEKLILNNKISNNKINQKIERYIKEFVKCRECGKPDTEIIKDSSNRITFIHCLACGAKHPSTKI